MAVCELTGSHIHQLYGTSEDDIEPHTCPYAEEINGDNVTLCECCDGCTTQCALDI